MGIYDSSELQGASAHNQPDIRVLIPSLMHVDNIDKLSCESAETRKDRQVDLEIRELRSIGGTLRTIEGEGMDFRWMSSGQTFSGVSIVMCEGK